MGQVVVCGNANIVPKLSISTVRSVSPDSFFRLNFLSFSAILVQPSISSNPITDVLNRII